MYTVNLGLGDGLAIKTALEVVDRDGLRCCDTVVNARLLDNLVYGLDLVSELGGDDLLLNNGLDGLVEMVVDGCS